MVEIDVGKEDIVRHQMMANFQQYQDSKDSGIKYRLDHGEELKRFEGWLRGAYFDGKSRSWKPNDASVARANDLGVAEILSFLTTHTFKSMQLTDFDEHDVTNQYLDAIDALLGNLAFNVDDWGISRSSRDMIAAQISSLLLALYKKSLDDSERMHFDNSMTFRQHEIINPERQQQTGIKIPNVFGGQN